MIPYVLGCLVASRVTVPVKWDRLMPDFSRDAHLSSYGVLLLIGCN